jgi:hypothetical protein
MDTAASSLNSLIAHPAALFIGQPSELLEHVIMLLQQQLCPEHGCSVCTICRKVQEQQHESILWLAPEKQYAIDDLKSISATLSFSLEPGQHFFFVLTKADTLTPACANALLKSLEEPPAGYHFILLAQRQEAILPTIQSRCLIHTVGQQTATAALASLMPYFTTTAFQDPLAFTKELESANPTEWQSIELLDTLLAHWAGVYKKNIIAREQKKAQQAYGIIMQLKRAIMQPPMPGSSKLFWKNLFLQIKEI